jgi:hypothetical protein
VNSEQVRGLGSVSSRSLFTVHSSRLLLRRLRVPGRQGYPARHLTVEADLEGILSGTGEGNVEHQYRSSLDIHHPRRWLTELHGAFPSEELVATLVHKADADGMNPDFRAASSHPQHQVSARVDCGKVGQPDVLKHAKHAQLSLLIDEGIIGDNREIEVQLSRPVWT